MLNPTSIAVRLSSNDFGQILDALIVLAEEWRQTAIYHEKGAFADDSVIRECNGATEARNMQARYERIIDELSRQLETNNA